MTEQQYRVTNLPNAEFYYYPDFLQNHQGAIRLAPGERAMDSTTWIILRKDI